MVGLSEETLRRVERRLEGGEVRLEETRDSVSAAEVT